MERIFTAIGPNPAVAQRHSANVARLCYTGVACLHSARRGPRRWQALDQALARRRGERSMQRCWTAAGNAAAPGNGGSPGSGASTWTLAPGTTADTTHEERQRWCDELTERRSRGADGVDDWLRRSSDGTAQRRPSGGADGVDGRLWRHSNDTARQ
jgi:hypothetical protein